VRLFPICKRRLDRGVRLFTTSKLAAFPELLPNSWYPQQNI